MSDYCSPFCLMLLFLLIRLQILPPLQNFNRKKYSSINRQFLLIERLFDVPVLTMRSYWIPLDGTTDKGAYTCIVYGGIYCGICADQYNHETGAWPKFEKKRKKKSVWRKSSRPYFVQSQAKGKWNKKYLPWPYLYSQTHISPQK